MDDIKKVAEEVEDESEEVEVVEVEEEGRVEPEESLQTELSDPDH